MGKKALVLVIFVLFLFGVIKVWPRSKSELPYPESIQANGNTVDVELVAAPSQVSLAPGMKIDTWTYNGQLPGPEIRIQKGDTLKINFTSHLPQETTIHFHGIRVPNAMDGVPGVTQSPVQPGESFEYEFTPKDAGTFWYHPHVRGSEQVERGLYGVIVVEDPTEPTYDRDQVIVLDDWRLNDDSQLDERFNTGRDLMHDGRWGNHLTVNGQTQYSLAAVAGERIRLRFVNTSNARVYQLDFGELAVKGFAVDGMLAREPFPAQGFELSPGSRLDVDVVIPSRVRSQEYVIRDIFTRQANILFTITAEGATGTASQFSTPVAEQFPEWTRNTKTRFDKEYRLNARRGGQFGIEWTINGRAYPNYEPITLNKGEYNVIRFTNESSRLHPMHLHGQFFKVLARDGRSVDEPFLRDTVLIKSKESVDVGLMPLDEGMWANHCHILEHAEAGMMTVVEVK